VPLRDELVERFRWIDGHADVWRLFSDGDLLARIADAVAEPFAGEVRKVAGIEARGFILGGAVAARLGLGFVGIRKEGGLLPGPKATRRTATDYRGHEHVLRIQRDALSPGDAVLLVDDWAETGSQALAVLGLVEECGARFIGASVVVDQLPVGVAAQLGRYHALVPHDALG
jgi:adenine phosphoribosyltransferase